MFSTTQTEQTPNPIVRRTALRAAPGWVVGEHSDGTLSLRDRSGYRWGGEITFAEAAFFARNGRPPLTGEVA